MIIKKICLITGSTQGIGLSIAEKLGLKGHIVIISSRKEENSFNAERILKENSIIYDYFTCDFNKRKQRKELFEFIKMKYGRLDVLICTVSVNPFIGESLSISENEFDKIFKANVKNTFFTILDFLPLLKQGHKPSIVIISSFSGYTPFPFSGIYSISKSAIFMMTKVLAIELSKFNIRVNSVAPGFVKSQMTMHKIYNKFAQDNFVKRMAMPHEISGFAAYLASDEASFINGEIMCVTGGMSGKL